MSWHSSGGPRGPTPEGQQRLQRSAAFATACTCWVRARARSCAAPNPHGRPPCEEMSRGAVAGGRFFPCRPPGPS
eukprot:6369788-Alexandrium_andersonii.AAC.1